MAGLVLLLAASVPARPQGREDPDWPCVQRKVAEISAGSIWVGPPVEGIGASWQKDPKIAGLVRKITARRTSIEDAKASIRQFAEGADNRRLTMLFAGALDTINRDRASIIAGIERYSKRQRALAAKIEHQAVELRAFPADGTPEQASARQELLEVQGWDTRIFEERERAFSFVCEQPVLMAQRAFALGREIMAYLD